MSEQVKCDGSAAAIVQLGRSHGRYKHQDQLLIGFMHMPGSTAKEVAKEYFDWKYEKYGDAPKRASDLASDKLQYLRQLDNRECRSSGKEAHTYEVTERGAQYLRRKGLLLVDGVDVVVQSVSKPSGRPSFSDLHSALI